MKNLLVLLALIISITSNAQDFELQSPTIAQQERAIKMADTLENQLGLTAKQEVLTKKCYFDYIVKENLILTSKRSIAEKNTALKALYIQQRGEMFDILTKPQRERYKKIRGIYDPLIQLKEEE